MTLKDNTISYCSTLYVADPATFLGSNSVLGTLFSSENGLLNQLMEKKYLLTLYYYLIIVNIEIKSFIFLQNYIVPL